METNMKKLYEDVSRQIRKEYEWAQEQYKETGSDYDRGVAVGYCLVVETILDYFEKEHGYKKDEA